MACFTDINVSQRSVAKYASCGGIFSIHLTTNVHRNLSAKIFFNQLRFDRFVFMSLCPTFWPTLYSTLHTLSPTHPCNVPGMLRRDISRRFIIIIIIITLSPAPVRTR